MAPEKQTLEKLNSINNKAQAADSFQIFLLHLYDFVEEFDNNPTLAPIIETINIEEKQDRQSVAQLEKQVLETLDSFYESLKSYRASQGIPAEYPDQFEAYGNPDPKKRIDTTRDVIIEKYQCLWAKFYRLAKSDPKHYEFVSHFATIECRFYGNHDIYVELKVHDYDELLRTKKFLADRQITRIWHHWNQIIWIFLLVEKEDRVIKKIHNQGAIFRSAALSDFQKTILNAINGQENHLTKLDIESLKYSVQRVFDYNKNLPLSTKKCSPVLPATLSLDETDGILYLGKKIIVELDSQSLEGKCCSLFLPGGVPLPTNQRLHWEQIFEDSAVSGDENLLPDQKRDRVYKTICRLNRKTKEKIGQPLLTYIDGYYKINPMLLPVTSHK